MRVGLTGDGDNDRERGGEAEWNTCQMTLRKTRDAADGADAPNHVTTMDPWWRPFCAGTRPGIKAEP